MPSSSHSSDEDYSPESSDSSSASSSDSDSSFQASRSKSCGSAPVKRLSLSGSDTALRQAPSGREKRKSGPTKPTPVAKQQRLTLTAEPKIGGESLATPVVDLSATARSSSITKARRKSTTSKKTTETAPTAPPFGHVLDTERFSVGKPKPHSRSDVWERFRLVDCKLTGLVCKDVAVCRDCLVVVSNVDGNTSSMVKHECSLGSRSQAKITQYPGVQEAARLTPSQKKRLTDACIRLTSNVPGVGFATHRAKPMLRFVQTIIDMTVQIGRTWSAEDSIPVASTLSRKSAGTLPTDLALFQHSFPASFPG
ncbi:hypothetical protein FOZ61_003145 [Perkinsus olseni]|uniref:BED-type domain-containing protein n=1 Tax=Perkinsus olseni TaxID=32597 RepID=A0A7J6KM97_PEROL|nr:hypothetical protein FOZ61_003145 [Perkinsus olseni]